MTSLLPGLREQEDILDGLRDLVERFGGELLVFGPELALGHEARCRETPPGFPGLYLRLRWLADQAGLEDVELDWKEPEGIVEASEPPMRFRGFEWVDDRLVLETDEALAPVEEDELMAELAFTIAQVVVPEGVPELTAFYLGFGAWLARCAHRYHASGWMEAGWVYTQWSHRSFGRLTPEGAAFALAAVNALAPDAEPRLRALAPTLPTNTRAYFEAAWRGFEADPEALRARLGVGSVAGGVIEDQPLRLSDWGPVPERWDVGAAPGAISVAEGEGELSETQASEAREAPLGFMVEQPRRAWVSGAALGGAAGLGLALVTRDPAWFASIPVGAVLGALCRSVVRYCSDPDCASALEAEAEFCPGCGAHVAGIIRHPNQRLAAADALMTRNAPPEEAG